MNSFQSICDTFDINSTLCSKILASKRGNPGIFDNRQDLLKSLMQKSVRRNVHDDLLFTLYEHLLCPILKCIYLSELGDDQCRKRSIASLKGIITNMVNRLRIVMVEDISLGDVYVVGDVGAMLDALSDYTFYSQAHNFEICIMHCEKIAKRLTVSGMGKVRLPSFLRATFYDIPQLGGKLPEIIQKMSDDTFSETSLDVNPEEYASFVKLVEAEMPKTSSPSSAILLHFKQLFNSGKPECFLFFFFMAFSVKLNRTGKGCVIDKTGGLKVAATMVKVAADALREQHPTTIRYLEKWFKSVKCGLNGSGGEYTHQEFWIFGAQIIAMSVWRQHVQPRGASLDENLTQQEVNAHFKAYLKREDNIAIPQYCLDQHVRESMDVQKDKRFFILEGSHVLNDMCAHVKVFAFYKALYQHLALNGYKRRPWSVDRLTPSKPTVDMSKLVTRGTKRKASDVLSERPAKRARKTTKSGITGVKNVTTLPSSFVEAKASLMKLNIVDDITHLPFNGEEVRLDQLSVVRPDAPNELEKRIEILNACRPYKPCHTKNPNSPMCFCARILGNGQLIILKSCSSDVPDQCAIDEEKAKIGLKRMETHYLRVNVNYRHLGTTSAEDGTLLWSVGDEPHNFEFISCDKPKTFLIIKYKDYHTELKPGKVSHGAVVEGLTHNECVEVTKIILFKFAITDDNGLNNVLKRGVGDLLSIDEEKFATHFAAGAKKKNKSIDVYLWERMRKKYSEKALTHCFNMVGRAALVTMVQEMREKLKVNLFPQFSSNLEALAKVVETHA